MAMMQLHFLSETLGRQTSVNILLPQNMEGFGGVMTSGRPPFPVLYLLHGLSDNQDAWLRNSSIERYASGRNLCVVMPATDRGFYTDTAYGVKYFTYISEELPELLRQYLPLSDRREDNYAAGLSMGGYGALKLALRNPGRFCFAASLSGAAVSREMNAEWEKAHSSDSAFLSEMHTIFGDVIKPEDDVFRLMETAVPKPKLFICCGMEDFLFDINVLLRGHAEKLGYDLRWRADEKFGHTWDYWDLRIQEVLDMLPEQTKPV